MANIIKYSIPVKVVSNNSALRCTIPKEIVRETNIKKGDLVVWTLYKDNKIEIRIEKGVI